MTCIVSSGALNSTHSLTRQSAINNKPAHKPAPKPIPNPKPNP